MKIQWKNITQFLRVILMIMMLAFCLSACSSKDNENGEKQGGEVNDQTERQQRACWQASVLSEFYDIMGKTSVKAYPHVTSSALPFMMVAFSLWLSIKVLRHVSSVTEESAAETWTEVSRMAFMCLFCGLLASSTSMLLYALNTFIFPIYYTFLEFSSAILNLTLDAEAKLKGQYIGDPYAPVCLAYPNELVCKAPALTPATEEAGFPKGPSEMMQCLACSVSDRMQLGFAIAKNLFKGSISAFLVGLILYVLFLFIKISFVFYLIDSIFRMAIVMIILPFLILAIPFKATRKWTKQGFETIINSSATMMCLALIITMTMLAMQTLISKNGDTYTTSQMEHPKMVLLGLILMGFLIIKSCGIAVQMADSIVGGGGGTKFQEKIAKLAAQAGKGLLHAISMGVGKMFTSAIESIKYLQNLKREAGKVKSKLNALAGRE